MRSRHMPRAAQTVCPHSDPNNRNCTESARKNPIFIITDNLLKTISMYFNRKIQPYLLLGLSLHLFRTELLPCAAALTVFRASNCSQLYEAQVVNSPIQCKKAHHTQHIAHPIAHICKRSPAQFCRLHRDSSQEWTLASSHSRYDRRCRPGRGGLLWACAHPSVDHRGDSGFGHRSAHHRRVVPTHRHRAVDRSRRLGCATRWVCAAAALACGCRLHAIIGFIRPCA